MTKLRNIFEQKNRSRIFVFCLFFAFVLLFAMLFHSFVFHELHLRLRKPLEFAVIWLPKIAVSLLIALPVWFSRRNWWTILALFTLDVWIIANILYFRANNILLTYNAIMMANNLGGVGGSVWMFVNWKSIIFLALTLFYGAIVLWLAPANPTKPGKVSYITAASLLVASYLLSVGGGYANYRIHYYSSDATPTELIQPFVGALRQATEDPYRYVEQHSVHAYLPIAFLGGLHSSSVQADEPPVLNENEKQIMQVLDVSTKKEPVPKRNVLLICVESLESWPIDVMDMSGAYIMPNLHALSHRANAFYAPHMKSQVRHGVSSDGHMILNTGILPLQNGAACRLLPDNTYPNYAHLFANSVLVNAVAPDFWNNATAARNYGYQKLVKPVFDQEEVTVFEKVMDLSWSDGEMFDHALQEWQSMESPKCMMALTLSSHSPFTLVPENENLQFPPTTPKIMRAYFSCLHYTDSCLGVFLSELEKSGALKNTVVAITGDHTVFKDMLWWEFQKFMENHDMPTMTPKNYVPFIVFAPKLKHREYKSECQQADIYPTILSLIGCEKYHWKGVGVNLIGTTQERPMEEKQAYILCDKLLRSDYFGPPKDLE